MTLPLQRTGEQVRPACRVGAPLTLQLLLVLSGLVSGLVAPPAVRAAGLLQQPGSGPVTAEPIRSLDSEDFSNLAFLEERLDGVRIVQLGEAATAWEKHSV